MSQHQLSLIDVLNPPENPWLKEVSRRNAIRPAGVRIVRFGDDDADDLPSDAESAQTPRSRPKPAPMREAA